MSTLQTTILKHPDSSTNNIRFDSSGRVGFGGTNTPVGVVTIYDSTNAYLYFQNAASGTSSADGFSVLHHSSGDTFIANRDNGDIAIEAGGAEALRIKSDRRVAVGTSSPPNTADFTVRAANPELSLYASANYSSYLMMGDTDDYDNGFIEYDNHDPNKFMKFVTNGAERLRIRKDGVIKHTGLAGGGGDNKLAQYVVPSHNTNEEDVLVFQAENEGSFNQISFGGGTSSFNAVTKIRFLTAGSVDTTTGTERMSIGSDGAMRMGDPVGTGDGGLTVFTSDVGTAHQRGRQIMYAKSSCGDVQEIFQVFKGSTGKLLMRADGNLYNASGGIGQLSDLQLKENIVSANSQWDDIKAIQIRNFNFKEETGHSTHTQIGVVAQEVETVSPGLVQDQPDKDENGNDLGTTTKLVTTSVLYMKAVKALQEAMARIEELEAKVAALEAG